MKCFRFDLNNMIKIEMFNKEHLIPPRKHVSRKVSTYIFYYVVKGVLPLKINGRECFLNEGTAYLFEPGDSQEPISAEDCEYFFIHFNSPGIEKIELSVLEFSDLSMRNSQSFANSSALGFEKYNYFFAYVKMKTEISNKDFFQNLVATFEKNCIRFGENDSSKLLKVSCAFAEILLKLEKYSAENSLSGRNTEFKNYRLIAKVREYLDCHFNHEIDSKIIEETFSFQYDYLNRLFKRVTGDSIIKYRNNHRIEMAKFLLSSTEKEISTIATELGFKDCYYFVRYFKKIVGCSPSQFRKILKNENDL